MNLFILDNDIRQSVQWHFDSHVRKIILESLQITATNIEHLTGIVHPHKPYVSKRHLNHPCTIWGRQSFQNMRYILDYCEALLEEFQFRQKDNNHHASEPMFHFFNILSGFIQNDVTLPYNEQTPFALAMPDCYKSNDAVASYRNYYIGEKQHLAKWTRREPPPWWS